MSLKHLLLKLSKDRIPLIGARVLASVVGQIISLQYVLGNRVCILTRHTYNCILSRASWNSPVLVSTEAIEEMRFWKTNARSLNMKGKGLNDIGSCHISVFCDASAKRLRRVFDSKRVSGSNHVGFKRYAFGYYSVRSW